MEGFYAIYYTGVAGFGHAVAIFKDGSITGTDATGGVYDGKYSDGDNGTFSIEVELTVPAGTTLVTGQTLPTSCSQTIAAHLPKDFAKGYPMPVKTPLGPVNAVFKKLRNIA